MKLWGPLFKKAEKVPLKILKYEAFSFLSWSLSQPVMVFLFAILDHIPSDTWYTQGANSHRPQGSHPMTWGMSSPSDVRFPLLPATRLIQCVLARVGGSWATDLPSYCPSPCWVGLASSSLECGQNLHQMDIRSLPLSSAHQMLCGTASLWQDSCLQAPPQNAGGTHQPWPFPYPYASLYRGREHQHSLGREGREQEAAGAEAHRGQWSRQWRIHLGRPWGGHCTLVKPLPHTDPPLFH